MAELRRQRGSARGRITVLVTDGEVSLDGLIYDLDHLDYVDPNFALTTGL